MSSAACLACKSRRNHPLHYWDSVPLSVLGLPRSEEEAKSMASFVMDLRQCAMCGHVFHTEFDYSKIPYRTGSNLTYNKAHYWIEHQRELAHRWMSTLNLQDGTVVEIGCGEGDFLAYFKEGRNECVAFEPGPDAEIAAKKGLRTYQEYFQPSRMWELKPSAIICRHVLEHLEDPLDFLQDISLACNRMGISPYFLAEVPQVDKALAQCRINDFIYEHVSHFTKNSFRELFENAGFEVLSLESGYDDEVVTLAARPKPDSRAGEFWEQSRAFRASFQAQVDAIEGQVARWQSEDAKVALWGGTGKAAAMITTFDLNKDRFPVVVDSDLRKEGSYVPGTGQRIEGPAFLQKHPVDAILICTQWRARDIEHEIRTVHAMETPLFVYHRGEIVPLTPDLEI